MKKADFTDAGLLTRETHIIVEMLKKGLTEKETVNSILNNNLFQYGFNYEPKTKRNFNIIIKRLKLAGNQVVDIFYNADFEEKQEICFAMVLEQSSLLRDFINQSILTFNRPTQKYYKNYMWLAFLDERYIDWSRKTAVKYGQTVLSILKEIGIVDGVRENKISGLLFSFKINNYLSKSNWGGASKAFVY